ncbi:hypothetical protein ACFXAZ_29345 [Streptomyces sp. NPDC059477]|uniref:hypothetical protein n=1 Tax=Streptomyces sp. NPDC059477 TaxID=3346847 RepID=UPI003681CF04
MSVRVPLASGRSELFEAVLEWGPDWAQEIGRVLIPLALVVSLAVRFVRGIVRERAQDRAGAGEPSHGQGGGADHLGDYAPQPESDPHRH